MAGKNKFIIGVVALVLIGVAVFYLNNGSTPKEQIQEIVISSCSSINPAAVSVTDDKILAFINKDTSGHTVNIGGKSFLVSPGKNQKISSNLPYGPGNYLYDCDSVANAGQVIVSGERFARPIAEKNPEIKNFKNLYDALNDGKKSCVKAALMGDFQKAYDDPKFIPAEKVIKKIDGCLALKINGNK